MSRKKEDRCCAKPRGTLAGAGDALSKKKKPGMRTVRTLSKLVVTGAPWVQNERTREDEKQKGSKGILAPEHGTESVHKSGLFPTQGGDLKKRRMDKRDIRQEREAPCELARESLKHG